MTADYMLDDPRDADDEECARHSGEAISQLTGLCPICQAEREEQDQADAEADRLAGLWCSECGGTGVVRDDGSPEACSTCRATREERRLATAPAPALHKTKPPRAA